jgi:hypothetical protein
MKRGGPLRRLLVSGLLLSLGGWAADQLWGRGAPRAATAAATPGAAAAPSGSAMPAELPKALPLATRLLPQPYASLAARLSSVPRDPFTPSPLMDALLNPAAPPPAPAAPPPPPEDPADAFRAAYQLEGVVMGPQPLAVVNGRILTVGVMLDDWQLVRVERERVTFRRAGVGRDLILHVPEPCERGSESQAGP